MPYIKGFQRVRVDAEIDALAKAINGFPDALRPGVLNYTVTRLLRGTVLAGDGHTPARYADHNEALGVLEATKLELYRRLTAPYEEAKLKAHGDVA